MLLMFEISSTGESDLPGQRAKRGPAFSLPHAAVPGPIGLLCMQPLAEEIIAAPATSLGGLRAKALVALWEAYPTHASHEGTLLNFAMTDLGRCSRRSPS
jgi:hypothetical protein